MSFLLAVPVPAITPPAPADNILTSDPPFNILVTKLL